MNGMQFGFYRKRASGRWTIADSLVTGGAGTLTKVVWTSPIETPPNGQPVVGLSLSSGDIVFPRAGDYSVSGVITFEGKLLLLAVRVRLSLYDGVTLYPRVDDTIPARTSGDTAPPFQTMLLGVPEGYVLRTEVASIGVGQTTVTAGDTATHIIVRALN